MLLAGIVHRGTLRWKLLDGVEIYGGCCWKILDGVAIGGISRFVLVVSSSMAASASTFLLRAGLLYDVTVGG